MKMTRQSEKHGWQVGGFKKKWRDHLDTEWQEEQNEVKIQHNIQSYQNQKNVENISINYSNDFIRILDTFVKQTIMNYLSHPS